MGPMYSLMHDADDDGNVVQEIVLVDHTITAPKARSFESQYTLDLSTDTTNDGEDTADDDTFESLLVGDNNGTTAPGPVERKLVMSGAFVAGAGKTTTLDFDSDDAGTNTVNEAYKASGSYDGAPGTYQCNAASGTDCTVTLERNPKGMVSISEMSVGVDIHPGREREGLRGGHGVRLVWRLAQAYHGRGRRADLQHG